MALLPILLCVSEDLYLLYDVVTRVAQCGFATTCAGSHAKAAKLIMDEQIGAVLLAGRDEMAAASLKLLRPGIPLLLITSDRARVTEPIEGADLVIYQNDFDPKVQLPQLLQSVTAEQPLHFEASSNLR